LAESVSVPDKFDPVSKGIRRVEPAAARQRLIPYNRKSSRPETLRQFIETKDAKRGMSLFLRREVLFHPEVNDGSAAAEPASPATRERPGLGILPHADQVAEKCPRPVLFSRRHRQLQVVQTRDHA